MAQSKFSPNQTQTHKKSSEQLEEDDELTFIEQNQSHEKD